MIISLLTVIAIPILEIPLKKSLKTIKNYSQIGLSSLKNSGFLLKEYRLLEMKISIKSYLYAAKNMFMSESYLPSTAADLNRYTSIVGCSLTVNQSLTNFSKDCIPLSNKLNISSWDSENKLFKIEIISSKTKLNILAIPYIKENKGINGCFYSDTGIIKINTVKGKNLKNKIDDC